MLKGLCLLSGAGVQGSVEALGEIWASQKVHYGPTIPYKEQSLSVTWCTRALYDCSIYGYRNLEPPAPEPQP